MARATRGNGLVDRDTLPSNMRVFTVMQQTICDSLGAYCTEGQEAALTEADARRYYNLRLVQAAMPLFEEQQTLDSTLFASAQAQTNVAKKGPHDVVAKPTVAESAKVEAAAGEDSGQSKQEPAANTK